MKPSAVQTSPLAIASLAFSCLGAISMGILCIPGILCGILAKRQIRRGEFTGGSLAQAGIIVGIAVLILYLAVPAFLFSLFAARGLPSVPGIFNGLDAVVRENLGAVIAATGVLILLVLLPFAFSGAHRLREKRSLRRVIDGNRSRGLR